jgi:hypothetical protein
MYSGGSASQEREVEDHEQDREARDVEQEDAVVERIGEALDQQAVRQPDGDHKEQRGRERQQ